MVIITDDREQATTASAHLTLAKATLCVSESTDIKKNLNLTKQF